MDENAHVFELKLQLTKILLGDYYSHRHDKLTMKMNFRPFLHLGRY